MCSIGLEAIMLNVVLYAAILIKLVSNNQIGHPNVKTRVMSELKSLNTELVFRLVMFLSKK